MCSGVAISLNEFNIKKKNICFQNRNNCKKKILKNTTKKTYCIGIAIVTIHFRYLEEIFSDTYSQCNLNTIQNASHKCNFF